MCVSVYVCVCVSDLFCVCLVGFGFAGCRYIVCQPFSCILLGCVVVGNGLAWIALSDRVSREFAQMPDVHGATPIERLNMFGLQSEFFLNPRFNLLVGGPRCPILWYHVVLSRFSSSQKLSCIRSLQSTEPWRPRDVLRAGRPPPRRVARGSRPGGRPSAARRRAARSAVPAGASPRRAAMMTPRKMVQSSPVVIG